MGKEKAIAGHERRKKKQIENESTEVVSVRYASSGLKLRRKRVKERGGTTSRRTERFLQLYSRCAER